MSDDYEFTTDWFHWSPPVWEQLLPLLPDRKRFLEVGAFEGRSTIWTVENMIVNGGEIHCIDTWEGSEEHDAATMDGSEKRFNKNIKKLNKVYPKRKVHKYKSKSNEALGLLNSDKDMIGSFDFVFIDGSHQAPDVMSDALMSWNLLKVDGLIVFDDYIWGAGEYNILHRPKFAIDIFTTLMDERVKVVAMGTQFVIQKMKD